MLLNRFRGRLPVVTAFEAAYHPPTGVDLGNVHDCPSQTGEVLRLQSESTDRIEPVSIEPGADQDKLWHDALGRLVKGLPKSMKVIPPRYAVADRNI